MRRLSRKEILIRFGITKEETIETAYMCEYRTQKFTIRRHRYGVRPWTIDLHSIQHCGFHGLTQSFETKEIAVEYAKNQIDAVLGKSAKSIVDELF